MTRLRHEDRTLQDIRLATAGAKERRTVDKSIYYQRHLKWLVSLAFLAASTTCLVAQNPLPAVPAITRTLTMKEIFAFLFLMLGPLKILGPFAQLTAGCDGIFTRRLAVRAIIISCASLAFVALIGEKS